MRSYFETALEESSGFKPTANQIDEALLNSQLPTVLVFEFGDLESLDAKINSLLSESGYTTHFSVSQIMVNYEMFAYPDQALQKFTSKPEYLTISQKEKLRNNGLLNKPFETDLYVNNSADNSNVAKFEYKSNGIYQTFLSIEDLGVANNEDFSFTIADENGNTVYGVEENTRTLDPFSMYDSTLISNKEQVFLNGSLTGSIKANMTYCNSVILRIDMRAGVNNPLISMFGVNTIYGPTGPIGTDTRIYGDVDNDNTVTISDATAIQMYLAKMDNSLSGNDLTVANVSKTDELDIQSATAIQMYLAYLDSESKTGENIYFVNFIDIKYID